MSYSNMRRGIAAALVTCVTVACEDVPLLPKWDADWYLPVPSSAIYLNTRFPAVPIPPGTSATVADTSLQSLDDAVGDLLDQEIRSASLIVTLSKAATLAFSAFDTVIVANNRPALSNPAAARIEVPISFTATDTSVTDTTAITAAALNMLRQTAAAGDTLFVVVRGRVTYNGTGPYTVQSTDSIGVRLALLARIAVSR